MTRDRKLLGILVLIVLIVFSKLFLPSASELNSNAKKDREQAQLLLAQGAVANESLAVSETFASDLTKMRTLVPVEVELPGIINKINAAVGEANMTWTSGAPGEPVQQSSPNGPYNSWQMSMTIKGSLVDVPKLLYNLYNLDRLFIIDSVLLRDSDTTVTLSINARFFATAGDPAAFVFEQQATSTTVVPGG
jgi:Tfp pilus assembly protein PilO